MTRTAIIAALHGELKPLVRGWTHDRSNGVDLWRRPRNHGDESEVIAACAGAGQPAATRAFAEIEKSGPIHVVISTGWAGALREDLQSGHAYLVSAVLDTRTGERFPTALNSELDAALKGHDFSRADRRNEMSRASAPEGCILPLSAQHSNIFAVTLATDPLLLVTTPTVAAEPEKHRLAATYSAALVDMEAAAIARLAQMRQIPFFCIKGVSDALHDQLPDFNRFIGPTGQLQLSRLILFSFLHPWYWPALIQMGENSSKAAKSIAVSLLDILNEVK